MGRAGREGVAITLAEPREHRQLKTIERVAGAPITVEKVPTVADLRNRRLELTRAALRESLLTDDFDRYRAVVETLTDEFDVVEVALAAVKLAHEAAGGGADDDEEIPVVSFRADRDPGRKPEFSGSRGTGRGRGAGDPRVRAPACRSAPAARPGSARATWSVRSPARPVSPGRTSDPSRSTSGSPWSRCPSRPRTRWSGR